MPPTITRGQWTQSVALSGIRTLNASLWVSDGTAANAQLQDGSVVTAGHRLGDQTGGVGGHGDDPDYGCFITWVTGSWDTTRNQLLVTCGSGDQGWVTNEVNVFDLPSGVWIRKTDPPTRLWRRNGGTWTAGTVLGRNVPGDASPTAFIDTTGLYHANAVAVNGQFLYPNGRQHYGGMMYMPTVDKYLLFGGVGWYSINGGANLAFEWDPAALKWEGLTADPNGQFPGEPLMCWDSTNNRVLCFCGSTGDTLLAYYPTRAHGSRWVTVQAHLGDTLPFTPSSINYAQLIWDSHRKWALMFGGQLGCVRWDLSVNPDVPSTTQQIAITGDSGWTAPGNNSGPGVLYDPVDDKYIGWVGGKTFYRVTPSTMASVATTPSSGATPSIPQLGQSGTGGVWNRFAYLPAYDVYATINHSADLGAFVYAPVRVPAPVLACTDLLSGPRTGNADTAFGQLLNQDGAYVTIYGWNFGNVEDTVTCTINGAAARIVDRGQATGARSPATLYNQYQRLQMIVAQVSHLATVGAGVIDVVVNGQASTASDLPFTVTATGGIYYVPGNFTSVQTMFDTMVGGDVGYVRAGVNATSGVAMRDNTGRSSNGQQIALVAYPGAAIQLGDAAHQALWQDSSGSGGNVTLAKFNVLGPANGLQPVTLRENGRFVGCKLQQPQGFAKIGALGIFGSTLAVLANEFTNCGASTDDGQYHVIYRYGRRGVAAVFRQVEAGCEIAHNYFHDNLGARAINCFNRNNEGDTTENFDNPIGDHHLHHNVIVNQSYAGIGLLNGAVGTNRIHDNLLINCGLVPGEPTAPAEGMEMHPVWTKDYPTTSAPITVEISHNTLVNCGDASAGSRGAFKFSNTTYVTGWTLTLKNNIISQATGLPYISSDSDAIAVNPTLRSTNLWFGAGAPPAFDTSPLNVNPQFVSSTAPVDLHLQATSQAIGAGPNLGTPSRDVDGVARPASGAWDLGAYQFGVTLAPVVQAPVLTSLQPPSCLPGAAPFTLTVFASAGQGFLTGAQVFWDGAARTTTVVNSQQASIQILAADVTVAATHAVTATNPSSALSNSLPFNVTLGPATLTLAWTGLAVDRVGQSSTALGPDGALDGVVTVTVQAVDGLARTITALHMDAYDAVGTNIGIWDTTNGPVFVLGTARTVSGAFLNDPTTMAVNFPVATGGTFVVIASDYLAREFVAGNTLTVIATLAGGSTASGSVRIAPPAPPVLTSLNPSTGPAGIQVTLLGSNFSATAGGNTVLFGSTPATIVSEGASAIIVLVPLLPDGPYLVTVTTAAGTSNALPFQAATLVGAGSHPIVRTRFRRWS